MGGMEMMHVTFNTSLAIQTAKFDACEPDASSDFSLFGMSIVDVHSSFANDIIGGTQMTGMLTPALQYLSDLEEM